MQLTAATPPAQQPEKSGHDQWMRRNNLIWELGVKLGQSHFPTGDRAALRRYEPGRNKRGETVTIKLLLGEDGDKELAGPDIVRNVERWTWLLHCMAIMSGPERSPHNDEHEIDEDGRKTSKTNGKILLEADIKESRLTRLLNARGDTFDDLFARTCRKLAAKGKGLKWAAFTPLIFDEHSPRAERARLQLAKEYYAAEAKAKAASKK